MILLFVLGDHLNTVRGASKAQLHTQRNVLTQLLAISCNIATTYNYTCFYIFLTGLGFWIFSAWVNSLLWSLSYCGTIVAYVPHYSVKAAAIGEFPCLRACAWPTTVVR